MQEVKRNLWAQVITQLINKICTMYVNVAGGRIKDLGEEK